MERLKVFCERFGELMNENGHNVLSVSKETGIIRSRLYDFLSGKHAPSLENAIKIAKLYKCTLDYLFGYANDFIPKEPKQTQSVTQRLKGAIDGSKLTRYQLCKLTGISEPQLSRWYNGKQQPSLVSLLTLSDALNFTVDYLAGF